MIKLTEILSEDSSSELDKKAVYLEYKAIHDFYSRVLYQQFNETLASLQKLEKMAEEFDDKVTSRSLSPEYRDSDEYAQYISPLRNAVYSIYKFAGWALPSVEYDLDELNHDVEKRSAQVPSKYDYLS